MDPSGEVVPPLGRRLRQGRFWRLPRVTGKYTLRVTPEGWKQVDRRDQSLLRGYEVSVTLDGAPGHLSLDRPGRVGMVSVTVPAGLAVRLTQAGEPRVRSMSEELFSPDGQLHWVGGLVEIDPTQAGTYQDLVSADRNAELDFYASTPAPFDAQVGGTTPFDLGAAPQRAAEVTVPVTAGQLFSFEVLDPAGEWCAAAPYPTSGGALLEWVTDGFGGHPAVLKGGAERHAGPEGVSLHGHRHLPSPAHDDRPEHGDRHDDRPMG